jgi:hypothetical protein
MAFTGRGGVILARKMRSAIGRAIGKWRLFREIESGHRFQARYHSHRCRREQGEASKWGRIFNFVGGPALIVAGFLFIPTPGPSYIIIVIGLWMLAGEFLPLARTFDWAEVQLRELGRWVRNRWSRLPAVVKVLVISASVAALGYGAYYLVFGG